MYYVEETGVDILVLTEAMLLNEYDINVLLVNFSHRVVLRTPVKS